MSWRVFCLFLAMAAPAAAQQPVDLPPLHHVVNVKPSAQREVPDAFPLDHRGRLSCETCHATEDVEDLPAEEVDRTADDFLRGGPYADPQDFCYRCHRQADYPRRNIHDLLDAPGRYRKQDCTYCHKQAPDPSRVRSRKEVAWRLPLSRLCLGCHLKTPHLNALSHAVKPEAKMARRLRAAERRLGVILPLDEQGRITCITCHAPHPRGLIDPRRPAGRQVADVPLAEGVQYVEHPWARVYRADKRERLEKLQTPLRLDYARLSAEVLLRLPAKDGSLCRACHPFDDPTEP